MYAVDDALAAELRSKMIDLLPVVTDSVCGMRVSAKTASYGTVAGCLQRFKLESKLYIHDDQTNLSDHRDAL